LSDGVDGGMVDAGESGREGGMEHIQEKRWSGSVTVPSSSLGDYSAILRIVT